MPTTDLHPVTDQLLTAFARRWRLLIVFRAVMKTVAVVLTGMLGVALLDRLIVMPDWVRIGLSVVIYAAGILILVHGLSPLVRYRGLKGISRLFASTQPWLGDDVISVVNLSSSNGDSQWDSPIFRELTQDRVAKKLAHIKVTALLPSKLVRSSFLVALVLAALAAALCLVPGFFFRISLTRAFLPLTNLERVTSNSIALLLPSDPGAPIPQNDPVEIEVHISGPKVDDVELLYKAGKSASSKIAMQQDAVTGNYRTSLPVGRDSVTFRVSAGDAVSREFKLNAQPRPEIVRFDKTYEFPSYTRQPALQISQEHGDVSAIEGTIVLLKMTADQPVSQAIAHIYRDDRTEDIPLVTDTKDPRQLEGRIQVLTNGRYDVQLTSRDTGFENKFRAQYEIIAQPDLRPTVQINEPVGMVSVASDAIVSIQGLAQDDVGLASISLTRVDQQSSDAVSLLWKDQGGPPTKQHAIATRVNIAELKLKPGDEISLRLDATDLKGSVGQSEPLVIHVVDSAMADLENETTPLSESLSELAAAVSQQETSIRELAKIAENEQVFSKDAVEINSNQSNLDQKIESVLNELRNEADNHDLLTADGRAAARDADDIRAMIGQPAEQARDAVQKGTAAKEPNDRQAKLNEAAIQQSQLAEALRKAAEHYRQAAEGNPDLTRPLLRAAEQPLGVKAPLDSMYGQVEKLAAMSQMPADELQQALEAELGTNPVMRDELTKLTSDAASEALRKLEQSTAEEKALGEALGSSTPPASTDAQNRQQAINETAQSAGEDLARAAANAEKLAAKDPAMKEAASALKAAASNSDTIGNNELAAAKKAVQHQSGSQALPSVTKAEAALRAQADLAGNAAATAKAAASTSNQSLSKNVGAEGMSPISAAAQPASDASKWMAAALDQANRPGAPSESTAASTSDSAQPGSSNGASSESSSSPSPQSVAGNSPSSVASATSGTMSGAAGTPDQPSAASAMQAAFEAQVQAMRDDRMVASFGTGIANKSASSNGNRGGNSSAGDLPNNSGGLPDAARSTHNTWGKLTQKQARDLAATQRDQVSPEYRAEVDAYFRAIAERANSGGHQ